MKNKLKKCNFCKIEKLHSDFIKYKGYSDRYCKVCREKKNKLKQIDIELRQKQLKKCYRCQEYKPLDTFCQDSSNTDGLSGYCKKCHNNQINIFRLNNNEEYRKKGREFHAKNKLDRNKRANERVRKQRFRALANQTNHRSRSDFTGEQITYLDLFRIAKKQKLICPISGLKLTIDNISVDHIIPYSKGGKHVPENIQLVVWAVNNMKNSHTTEDFLNLIKTIYLHNFK